MKNKIFSITFAILMLISVCIFGIVVKNMSETVVDINENVTVLTDTTRIKFGEYEKNLEDLQEDKEDIKLDIEYIKNYLKKSELNTQIETYFEEGKFAAHNIFQREDGSFVRVSRTYYSGEEAIGVPMCYLIKVKNNFFMIVEGKYVPSV